MPNSEILTNLQQASIPTAAEIDQYSSCGLLAIGTDDQALTYDRNWAHHETMSWLLSLAPNIKIFHDSKGCSEPYLQLLFKEARRLLPSVNTHPEGRDLCAQMAKQKAGLRILYFGERHARVTVTDVGISETHLIAATFAKIPEKTWSSWKRGIPLEQPLFLSSSESEGGPDAKPVPAARRKLRRELTRLVNHRCNCLTAFTHITGSRAKINIAESSDGYDVTPAQMAGPSRKRKPVWSSPVSKPRRKPKLFWGSTPRNSHSPSITILMTEDEDSDIQAPRFHPSVPTPGPSTQHDALAIGPAFASGSTLFSPVKSKNSPWEGAEYQP